MSRRKAATVVTTTAVVSLAAGLVAGYLVASPPGSDDVVLEDPVVLSGEAREGCQLLGMTFEDVALEPDVCLRLYWTPDRLTRSDGLYEVWLAHNGITNECSPDGLCDLAATEEPPLPPDEDPWWVEQALADPTRTTVGGTANSMRPDGRHDPQG